MNVVKRAEIVVSQAEMRMFDQTIWQKQEQRARQFRDRCRFLGLILGTMVLVIGLATTSEKTFLNLGWIVGTGLCVMFGVMIGRYVYRKRSPW